MTTLRQSSRADLLRAFASAGLLDDGDVADVEFARLARMLSFVPLDEVARPEEPDSPETQQLLQDPSLIPGGGGIDVVEGARRPPLRARLFTTLMTEEIATSTQSHRSESILKPLTAEDCGPRIRAPQPMPPLVARTRLWPALRRSLGLLRFGRLDMPGLVRRLARAENVRRLPRACRRDSSNEVWVIADVAQRLIPYESDYLQIIAEIERLQGKVNVRLWGVSESPEHALWVQQGKGKRKGVRGRVPTPPPGTPVLILGDLGLLSPARVAEPAWLDLCRRVDEGGARPVAWVPLSPRLVTRAAARHAQVHCLGVGDFRPLNPARCAEEPALPTEGLEALLTRIACCVRLEPALLRSLRLMQADTAVEPGLEALVWGHGAMVEAGRFRFCAIATHSQADYRARFGTLDAEQQDEVLRRMLAAHAHRGRSTESIEILVWQAHTSRLAPAGEEMRSDEARAWLARLGEHAQGDSDALRSYVADLLDGQGGDIRLMERESERFAQLWAYSRKGSIPAGLNPADVEAAWGRLQRDKSERDYVLVQQGERMFLEPRELRQKRELDGWASMPWPVVTIAGGFEWSRSDGANRQWFVPGLMPLELPLGEGPENCTFSLVSGGRRWFFGLLERPSWADEWGIGPEGLYVQLPSPAGGMLRLPGTSGAPEPWQGQWPLSPKAFQAVARQIDYGMRIGADLQYGLYLDVPLGSAIQRFRWIEPGEFLMGSPEGEAERYGMEGPRHVVRLTEGYWLAETACSQEVWESVMGSNPSRFKDDPQNPVEQVNWDDVQGFLREVEKRLPAVKADLPTEAEWEYACRAGSEKAFSWGDGITPDQANYNATVSYGNGPTGECRAMTVPVKTYAPNAWGLYQMHGNVWEWCADLGRDYDGVPQLDPRGLADLEASNVRGGSWFHGPSGLRAAVREGVPWVIRLDLLGFRCCLRRFPLEECAVTEAIDVNAGEARDELVLSNEKKKNFNDVNLSELKSQRAKDLLKILEKNSPRIMAHARSVVHARATELMGHGKRETDRED